jgi:hypothetical protein
LNSRFQAALTSGDRHLQDLIDEFRQGQLSEAEAALAVLRLISDSSATHP